MDVKQPPCDKDCFNCKFQDCIYDGMDYADYVEQAERDKILTETLETKKRAAQQRAYREANKEKIAAQRRAYREANKEKIAAQQRAYYVANKEKLAAQRRAYYVANKEKVAAQRRAYREANKEKIAAQQRAKPSSARPTHGRAEGGASCAKS